MKQLPIHRRPFFSKRVLEVGGGHNPYAGVTHAVDKFPADNAQRAGDLLLRRGVEFHEGDLEKLPFPDGTRFDFIYCSHVLEHVQDPKGAVGEINRIAARGYLETPSPLREQMACPVPYDATNDFHRLFCWFAGGELNIVAKGQQTVGEFCACPNGRMAARMAAFNRERRVDLEPLLPIGAKTEHLYFKAPVKLAMHRSFKEACARGRCAYGSVRVARWWASIPMCWLQPRLGSLRTLLRELA